MCGLLIPTVVLLLSISEIGQSNFHNNNQKHHALISSKSSLVHSELVECSVVESGVNPFQAAIGFPTMF